MRILVTGGAGFIGSHVVDALRLEAVVHHAAMVGMGVNLDDLPDHVACNDLGTAVLLAGMDRARVRRLVLASSMVVSGKGGYACGDHGPVLPGPRQPADLEAGRFDPTCPTCGRTLSPRLVTEDAPLASAQRIRRHPGRAGAPRRRLVPRTGHLRHRTAHPLLLVGHELPRHVVEGEHLGDVPAGSGRQGRRRCERHQHRQQG
jgi:hypothetical protein